MSLHGKMDFKPIYPPKFHNLEISGSWNGEFEGAVRLRISLDVQSAPGTELRLLDTKSSPIFLKTVSARLLSDESNDNSSLFAFSTSDSDKLKGVRRFSAERPPNSDEAFSTTQDDPPLPSRSVVNNIMVHRSTKLAEHFPYARTFSQLCVNDAEYEDLTKSPQLMKRSAADACFPDSDSDCDDAPTHKRQASSTETVKTLSPVLRTGKESMKADDLLGLEAWLETTAQQPGDSTLEEVSVSTGNSEPYREEGVPDNFKTAAEDVNDMNTKENDGLPTPVTGSPSMIRRQEFPLEQPDTTSEFRVKSPCDQEGSLSSLSASPGINLGTIEGLGSHMDAHLSSPNPSILFSTPKPSESNPETWGKHYLIEETDEDDDIEVQPLIEFSWSDPKLILLNGNLIVQFSSKTRQATYKIEVNLTLYVDDEYTKGWNTILLPGLPHLPAEETGRFFFLLPEDRGLEFRTTGMQRCMEMEGCFFAELTSTRDLAVAMRVCGRRFYGFLKDYVLDQEIIAHHVLSKSGAENDRSNDYHAMCSLRLNRRYICTEKCGFSFFVDGGPDGLFYCKLEHQIEGLQMIRIPNGDSNPTGVSRVQVICSPKDLETFCLAWSIPSNYRLAASWLPRIYSASPISSEVNRIRLRNTYTGLSHRGCYGAVHENDKPIGTDAANESHVSDDEASAGPDLPRPNVSEAPEVVQLLRLLASTLKANLIQLTKDCVTTAVPFMPSLYHWTWSLMKRLILAVATAYTLLGILTWISVKNATLVVLTPAQDQSVPLNMSELDSGNQSMVENIDAGLPACFDDSIFYADHRISSTCGSSSSQLQGANSMSIDSENYGQIEMQVQKGTEDIGHDDVDAIPDTKTAASLSFRDKFDYWLGWRGPINRRA